MNIRSVFRSFPIAVLVTAAFLLSACGGDENESYPPGAVEIEMDLDAYTITWDPIAGADTYALYVKTVEDCPDIDTAEFRTPTTSDTRISGVTSPLAIESYEGCTTCYYAAVVAENGAGEGTLSNAVGWQIRRNCP